MPADLRVRPVVFVGAWLLHPWDDVFEADPDSGRKPHIPLYEAHPGPIDDVSLMAPLTTHVLARHEYLFGGHAFYLYGRLVVDDSRLRQAVVHLAAALAILDIIARVARREWP